METDSKQRIPWGAVMTLLRSLIGGQSVLTVVNAVQQNGPVVGSLIVVIFSLAACHAMQLYADVCLDAHDELIKKESRGDTYDAVVGHVLGPKGRKIAAVLLFLKLFGTLVLQMYFSSESLANVAGRHSLQPAFAGGIAVLIWPSVFLRSVNNLKFISGYSCFFVYIFVSGVIACAVASPADDLGWGTPGWKSIGAGASLMAYASTNSNWVAPVAAGLDSDNRRSAVQKALRISFTLQMVFCLFLAGAGIMWHGKDVPANFLLAIPKGIPQRVVTVAFVSLVLVNLACTLFALQLSLPQLLRMLMLKVPEQLTQTGKCITGAIAICCAWGLVYAVYRARGSLANVAILQGAVFSTALDFVFPMIQVIASGGAKRRNVAFAVVVIVFGSVNGWVRIITSLPPLR